MIWIQGAVLISLTLLALKIICISKMTLIDLICIIITKSYWIENLECKKVYNC